MKTIIFILAMYSFIQAIGQDSKINQFHVVLGSNYNQSNLKYGSTTSLGLFVEPNLFYQNKIRFGYRAELNLLRHSVSRILPIGCGECLSGAFLLLNNYFKAEYLLGKPWICYLSCYK